MLREYYFHIVYPDREDSVDILFKEEVLRLFRTSDYFSNIMCEDGKGIEINNKLSNARMGSVNVLVGVIYRNKVIANLKKDLYKIAKFFNFKYVECETFETEDCTTGDYNNTVKLIINNYK